MDMRKKHSTKAERKFAELLKDNHIKFSFKQKVGKYEVDFLVDRCAIEINGHPQNIEKNNYLAQNEFIPLNFSNAQVRNIQLKNIKICL